MYKYALFYRLLSLISHYHVITFEHNNKPSYKQGHKDMNTEEGMLVILYTFNGFEKKNIQVEITSWFIFEFVVVDWLADWLIFWSINQLKEWLVYMPVY